MTPHRQFDGPNPSGEPRRTVETPGESLGPDTEALDRILDRLAAGDDAAHLPAAAIRDALRLEMPVEKAEQHRAWIRAAAAAGSPERFPDPGDRPAADIVPIEPARTGRGKRRTAVMAIAAVLLLTLGSGSALAAATDAKPGDVLYGVKRASERIALAMRRSPEAKAALHLKFAERRLNEIDVLAAAGKDVSDLSRDFAAELQAAGATASGDAIDQILERTRQHIAHLNEILGRVPPQAQKGVETAIENAERQQQRTEQRRTEQRGPGAKDETPGNAPGGRPESPGNSGNRPGR